LNNGKNGIIILGGGLTGLSAGYVLTMAGFRVKVFESGSAVGGLSKTVIDNGFRFDLGGHRFHTKDTKVDKLVRDLMGGELISVQRKSKIYMRNRYFDYPPKLQNAMLGFGLPTIIKILSDYGIEKAKSLVGESRHVSLEDWVVGNFGRTMFDIYFKEYSEKVWGIDCSRISAEWVAQRIRGLSLAKAVKSAFSKFSGKDIPSFADRFIYPELGIGRISDRLREEIEKHNNVFTDSGVVRVKHSYFRIESIEVKGRGRSDIIDGEEFISSMPVTKLVRMLDPAPPGNVLDAASKLRFRDLVVVAVMVDRKRATDQTWIYLPEKKIPFGRIHEPTNWSEKMAPEGKTILVAEYFSFQGDRIWNASDDHLADMTVQGLVQLGFIKKSEVSGSAVVRVKQAYPLFEIGYAEQCAFLYNYLGAYSNLHLAGRTGMFRYYNMDHAIESGLGAAEAVIRNASGAYAPQAA